MSCGNSNCSSCSPCPSCSPAIPETCEALGQTGTATSVVVEDSAFCKRTLIAPTNNSLIVQGPDGVSLQDGSTDLPICLSALQKQVAGSVNGIVGQDDSGCLVNSLPTSDANKYLPIGTGSSFVWTDINQIFGTDCGVPVKDCECGDPLELSEVCPITYQTGTSGQVLAINTDGNPRFVDASTLTAVSGFIDAQAISAVYASGPTIVVNFGQIVVSNGTADVVIKNATPYVLNLASVGAGGLDAGALVANTYYYIFAIYDKTNNIINVLASTSQTTPTMPGTFTYFRVIGLFRTTSAALVSTGYSQNGRTVNLGVSASVVVLNQGPTATTLYYSGAISGYAPYTCVSEATYRLDALGVTSTYESNLLIADQVAGATGAPVNLADTANQYGSVYLANAARTGTNTYTTFKAIVPYGLPSFFNYYLAAAIPSGDQTIIRIIGYTLNIF